MQIFCWEIHSLRKLLNTMYFSVTQTLYITHPAWYNFQRLNKLQKNTLCLKLKATAL